MFKSGRETIFMAFHYILYTPVAGYSQPKNSYRLPPWGVGQPHTWALNIHSAYVILDGVAHPKGDNSSLERRLLTTVIM